MKVISIYRLGDICLILAMWMSHHLWHENITFEKLNDLKLVEEHLNEHNWFGVFISLMIVVAAIAKSAQLPFSSWLPRAMEGPTTSSAIFYGSLSIHLGAFILLRTYNYWESIFIIKLFVVIVGAITAIVTSNIAKTQSSVKTQIAYSSIAQIGIIFIEISLGFHLLALIHFAANAFLRTYQLLVSPSVLSYQIHDMVFNFNPNKPSSSDTPITKIKNTLYVLSIKEWNLDYALQTIFWNPFKAIGKRLSFLSSKLSIIVIASVFVLGMACHYYQEKISPEVYEYIPDVFSFCGLILILSAFAERGSAIRAWLLVISGQLFITLSIALLNENFGQNHILIYLSGSTFSAFVGLLCLKKIKAIDNDILLDKFHGYSYEQPKTGFVFLLSCLGFIGLPFTPTFIGIDLLFSHIHKHQELLVVFTSLSFVFIELSILRIYARIFIGQHKKATHAIAYRSS